MFKAGELSSLDFKAFFVLKPLVRLMGRNGGLSLAIGLRASCAIGAKVVSLKSTLSTFWGGLVVSVIWLDRFAYIYARPISVVGWFAYIYARPFACLVRGLGLFETFFI
jgi:hypothetical protein